MQVGYWKSYLWSWTTESYQLGPRVQARAVWATCLPIARREFKFDCAFEPSWSAAWCPQARNQRQRLRTCGAIWITCQPWPTQAGEQRDELGTDLLEGARLKFYQRAKNPFVYFGSQKPRNTSTKG